MSFQDSLQIVRRRLLVVVVALLLGVVGGWFSASGTAGNDTTFRATHTLIYDTRGNDRSFNIEQVALLATSGAVPSRVAARLNVSRAEVRSAVSAVADAEVATISISGQSAEAERAVVLADITAEELITEIAGGEHAAYQAELDRLTGQVQAARDGLAGARGAPAQTAAQGAVTAAEQALQQYQSTKQPKSLLQTLEKAAATPVKPEGVKPPESRPARALLLGAIGLFVGVAGVLALDRFDSRIRSKSSAERAFGAPVVAEVPTIAKSSQGQLLTRTQPTSSFMEAYRGLRTYVALWTPETGEDDGHRVIVVTSPTAGDGKTTSVAHLAAMLAEIGRSVLVVSADLRRPRVHEYFDRSGSPGLVEVLSGKPGAPTFDDLDLSTSLRGVRLIRSGPAIENPAPLLEHAGDLLRAARGLADFVLVDTPPLLVANDAVDLARHADGVLLLARAGTTPIEAAERSAEQLARLEIPVVGVVLVASEAASTKSHYYSTRYYTEPERKGRGRARAGDNGQHPAAEAPSEPEEAPPVVSGS
jgi:capsular exopolysaccharide synthesis family protein